MVRLPTYVAPAVNLSRPEAGKINELMPKMQDVTFSGYNEVAPVVYGEQQVAGPTIAGPIVNAQGRLVYAVAISYAGGSRIEAITKIVVNGEEIETPPAFGAANTPIIINATGGVILRIYGGRQAIVDTTLKAAFGTAFTDTFTGVSYAVISIPAAQSATVDFENAVRFTVRGKRCRRVTGTIRAWTENPSLHLLDYVTDEVYGLGLEVEGAAECVAYNDSLYSGLPRARTGVVINEGMKDADVLDLLATYAEVLWSYSAGKIRIIPDKAVDGPVDRIEARYIKGDTIKLSGTSLEQMPTAVNVFFSDRDEGTEWGALPARAQTSNHELYGTAASISDVQLKGVYRRVEADRRAWQRLRRLQTPGRISWQMFDDGIRYQAGDVAGLPNIRGLNDLDVRIMAQPEMIQAGVYQLHAEIYRPDHYPAGKDGASIPPGGVLFYAGADTPESFEDISPSENVPIYGVGLSDSTGILAHTGQIPAGGIGFSLSSAGGHESPVDSYGAVTIVTSTPNPPHFISGRKWEPPHTHSGELGLDVLANSDGVAKRSYRVLRNAAVSLQPSPGGLMFLAMENLSAEGISEVNPSGRSEYLGAYTNTTTTNPATSVYATSTEETGHSHYKSYPGTYDVPAASETLNSFYSLETRHVGKHAHEVSGERSQKLKSKGVALYQLHKGALIPKGGIIGFIDSAVPSGWALCNGANGTPDLTEYFLMPKSPSKAGRVVNAESQTEVLFPTTRGVSASHKHKSKPKSGYYKTALNIAHSSVVSHTHGVSPSPQTRVFNYTPRRFGLRFIQYKG